MLIVSNLLLITNKMSTIRNIDKICSYEVIVVSPCTIGYYIRNQREMSVPTVNLVN